MGKLFARVINDRLYEEIFSVGLHIEEAVCI